MAYAAVILILLSLSGINIQSSEVIFFCLDSAVAVKSQDPISKQ